MKTQSLKGALIGPLVERCRFSMLAMLITFTVLPMTVKANPFWVRFFVDSDVNQFWLGTGGPGGVTYTLLSSDLTPVSECAAGHTFDVPMVLDLAPTAVSNYFFRYEHRSICAREVETFETGSFAVGQNLSTHWDNSDFHPGELKFSDVTGPGVWVLLRETMVIYGPYSSPSNRFEQVYRGPDGGLYLHRFSYGPELYLLDDLITGGYDVYNLSDFTPSLELSRTNIPICASENSTTTFRLTSNNLDSWRITSNQPWLTINTPSGSGTGNPIITLTAAENNTTSLRTAILTVSGAGVPDQTISVTQNPYPTATLSGDALICSGSSTNLAVVLTGTPPWRITAMIGLETITLDHINISPYIIPISPERTINITLKSVHDAFCSGNASGDARITVRQPPTLTCPGNIDVNSSLSTCGASVEFAATSTAAITYKIGDITITSPHVFPVGTTTVTATATNTCGSESCQFMIKVSDTEKPVITTAATSHYLGCNPIISAPTFSGTDNCKSPITPIVTTTGPVNIGPNYTQTWNANYNDDNGNSADPVSIVYTWKVDTEAPVITVYGTGDNDANIGNNPAAEIIEAALGTATANDLCDGAIVPDVTDGNILVNGCLRSQTRTWTATDACGNTSTFSRTINWKVDINPPLISGCLSTLTRSCDPGLCGAVINWIEPSATDNCTPESNLLWTRSHAPGSIFNIGTTTVVYTVTDECGNISTCSFDVTINNSTPAISSFAPVNNPAAINTLVNITLDFIDDNVISAQIAWDDGSAATIISNPAPSLSLTHTYYSVGVYSVTVTLTDACGAITELKYDYIVIYDPSGGFVTGGGWIDSPEGAYVLDPELTGKATFGFESMYKKGANVPSGNTEFQFHVAGMNFKSSSYDWLVIARTKAMFKGSGTINGSGTYGFMLSAIDGTPDKFRIKIWDKITGVMTYDNQINSPDDSDPSTAIAGGSIVIHIADNHKSLQAEEFGVKAYPNPFTDHIYFDLQLKTDSRVRLEIFDISGTKLATLYNDVVLAFDRYQIEYTPKNVSSGILFYHLIVDGQLMFDGKLIHY